MIFSSSQFLPRWVFCNLTYFSQTASLHQIAPRAKQLNVLKIDFLKTFSDLLVCYQVLQRKAQNSNKKCGCLYRKVFFGHIWFLTAYLHSALLNSVEFSHDNTVVTILDSKIFSYHVCRLEDKRHQDKCSQPEMHLGGLVTTEKRIGVGKEIRMLLHSKKKQVLLSVSKINTASQICHYFSAIILPPTTPDPVSEIKLISLIWKAI